MSESIFVGRQPILDRKQRVVAYELLYRDTAQASTAVIQQACQAATRVIANTFSSMGMDAVLGRCLGFINVTEELLHDDLIRALPAERIVVELLETIKASDEVLAVCEELKGHGFTLAIDDYVPGDPRDALLPIIDVVKVDLPAVPPAQLKRVMRHLRRKNDRLQILAEKVETRDEFERCLAAGFDLFQGYFFAKPIVVEGTSLDSARTTLMKLIAEIEQDADSVALAVQIKTEVQLGVNLLRLVNSASSGRVQSIEKVEDAIVHIGRQQLKRWLTILLYAGADAEGVDSPLLRLAAYRGRMMELATSLAFEEAPARDLQERAFLTGMLSLVDVLFGRPIDGLLDEMGVVPEIREALQARAGFLGGLLEIVESVEAGRFTSMADRSRALGLDLQALQVADAQSHAFVHELTGAH